MRVRALIGAMLVAGAALPALALVASADEDPPLRPVDAGPPLRPPLTVLRSVERAAPAAGSAPDTKPDTGITKPDTKKKELIVLVGGYASGDDSRIFDAFRARVARESGYDVVSFGQDLGAYDTFGAVDANATQLRDAIRTLSTSYDSVHIVTHSMGGVVADRAFALGLSASDGVTTYVSWAAPHDGAHAARALQSTLAVSGAARADTRSFTATYFRDPDSAAVRDMARVRASGPPPGVARLDLRLATDALVSSADSRDPGVSSRVLLPGSIGELEGHGGILASEEALDLTIATIRTRAVPSDDRGVAIRTVSGAVANTFDHYAALALAGVCGLCLLGGFGGLIRRSLTRRIVWPPLSE
jgi:PGAP1-like protein